MLPLLPLNPPLHPQDDLFRLDNLMARRDAITGALPATPPVRVAHPQVNFPIRVRDRVRVRARVREKVRARARARVGIASG